MKRVRGVLLFSLGLALVALIHLCGAAAAPPDSAVAAPPIAVTGQSAECDCEDELSCPHACSPLAGAWIARLWTAQDDDLITVAHEPDKDGKDKDNKDGKDEDDKDGKDKDGKDRKRILQTFKFAPVNEKCDTFVVNAQTITRPERVIKAFSEVTDLTEFVGIACKTESRKLAVTAISYGVERKEDKDKAVFIAVLSGTIELPKDWGYSKDSDHNEKDGDHSDKDYDSHKCKCCEKSCKDSKCSCRTGDHRNNDGHPGKCSCCKDGCKYDDCECKDGKYGDGKDGNASAELCAELTVAYFDAEQDGDCDGFPDPDEDPIVCLPYEARFKPVELVPPCKPWKKPAATDKVGVQG